MPVAPYPTFGAPLPGNYAGGVRPNTFGGAGPKGSGWVRVGGVPPGSGIVRPATGGKPYAGPAPKAPAAKPPAPAPAWPATGSFQPQRELEVSEAERGLHEQERAGATTRTRLQNQYATGMGELDRQTREELDAYNKGLGLLAESFQKLGTQQTEAENKAGVLQGGAVLASAAARAANEGKERTKRGEAHTKAQEAIDRARAKLIEEIGPPDATAPQGGLKWQDLATNLANLASNFTFFQQGQQSLAGQEAADRKRYETSLLPQVKWSRNPAVRTRQMREIQQGKLRA